MSLSGNAVKCSPGFDFRSRTVAIVPCTKAPTWLCSPSRACKKKNFNIALMENEARMQYKTVLYLSLHGKTSTIIVMAVSLT